MLGAPLKIIAAVDFSAQLKTGDSYELPESDARMLIAAGLAHPATTPAPSVPSVSDAPIVPPRTRSYTTRSRQASETKDAAVTA